jgi:hypothetical protein
MVSQGSKLIIENGREDNWSISWVESRVFMANWQWFHWSCHNQINSITQSPIHLLWVNDFFFFFIHLYF